MVIFLLEEPSMKMFLEVLFSRLFPDARYQLVPHEGKSDLERSIPRKVRGMHTIASAFVIVRDQHSAADCVALKVKIAALGSGSSREVVARIVCRELESWILGDLVSLENALQVSGIAKQNARRKFRSPDQLVNASEVLEKLCPGYTKTNGAKAVAAHFDPARCTSKSFQVFFKTVNRLLGKTE